MDYTVKRIFVSHPFRGNETENFREVTVICRRLMKIGIMPISPLHAFSFMHEHAPGERETALRFGRELMEQNAHEHWLFGAWERSDGCGDELRWAHELIIPVRIVCS
ncbi:hypothetical protein JCM15765_04270 [Paradesulfitobacterium aromaticivorans]